MDKLDVGDVVLVSGNKFSSVFMFTHKLGVQKATFIQLSTESNRKVTLSPGHFLEVNGKMIATSSVRVGDYLSTHDGTATQVTEVIEELPFIRLFIPQTFEGTIVVNGIVASTYTSAVEMSTAHTLLSPLRAAYKWLGISTSALEKGCAYYSRLEIGNAD